MKARLLLLCALSIVVASCSDTPTEPTTIPLPDAPAATATLAEVYDQAPDVAGCDEGRLKAGEKQRVLVYLNALRRIHGLRPVTYRSEDDMQTAKASLIIAANRTLTHTPATTVTCYSEAGSTGSGTSNIAYRGGGAMVSSETYIDLWLIDNNVVGAGHRRWLLDPFLKFISFGRVDRLQTGPFGTSSISGAAIKVVYQELIDIRSTSTEFIAYPVNEYPARLLPEGTSLSFTALPDRTGKFTSSRANETVDYSAATITMTTDAGVTIPTTIVGFDNLGAGVPNHIEWKAQGVVANTRYTVAIRNVQVNGAPRDYTYWFALR